MRKPGTWTAIAVVAFLLAGLSWLRASPTDAAPGPAVAARWATAPGLVPPVDPPPPPLAGGEPIGKEAEARRAPYFRSECGRPPHEEKETPRTRAALRELSASTDRDHRAAGLLLTATDLSLDVKDCSEDTCLQALTRTGEVRARAIADLATLAAADPTPLTYAWAVTACESWRGPDAPAACVNVTAEHLAALDPDSVWVWLRLAGAASRNGDVSGRETAMYRASLARDWSSRSGIARAMLADRLPGSLYSGEALMALAGTVTAGSDSTALQGLARYCDAHQNPNQAPWCQRIATGLLDHATDLLQLTLGVRVAERSGVDAARIERAKALKARAFGAAPGIEATQAGDGECRFIDANADFVFRGAQIGELAAMRERLQQLGR